MLDFWVAIPLKIRNPKILEKKIRDLCVHYIFHFIHWVYKPKNEETEILVCYFGGSVRTLDVVLGAVRDIMR